MNTTESNEPNSTNAPRIGEVGNQPCSASWPRHRCHRRSQRAHAAFYAQAAVAHHYATQNSGVRRGYIPNAGNLTKAGTKVGQLNWELELTGYQPARGVGEERRRSFTVYAYRDAAQSPTGKACWAVAGPWEVQ